MFSYFPFVGSSLHSIRARNQSICYPTMTTVPNQSTIEISFSNCSHNLCLCVQLYKENVNQLCYGGGCCFVLDPISSFTSKFNNFILYVKLENMCECHYSLNDYLLRVTYLNNCKLKKKPSFQVFGSLLSNHLYNNRTWIDPYSILGIQAQGLSQTHKIDMQGTVNLWWL